jgi:hypothetical protein
MASEATYKIRFAADVQACYWEETKGNVVSVSWRPPGHKYLCWMPHTVTATFNMLFRQIPAFEGVVLRRHHEISPRKASGFFPPGMRPLDLLVVEGGKFINMIAYALCADKCSCLDGRVIRAIGSCGRRKVCGSCDTYRRWVREFLGAMLTPRVATVSLMPASEYVAKDGRHATTQHQRMSAMHKAGCTEPSITTSDPGAPEVILETSKQHMLAHSTGGASHIWCGLTIRPCARVVEYIYDLRDIPGLIFKNYSIMTLCGRHASATGKDKCFERLARLALKASSSTSPKIIMVNTSKMDGRHKSNTCSSLRISQPASFKSKPGWYDAGVEASLYRLEMAFSTDTPCAEDMCMGYEILFYLLSGWEVGGHFVYFFSVFAPEDTVWPRHAKRLDLTEVDPEPSDSDGEDDLEDEVDDTESEIDVDVVIPSYTSDDDTAAPDTTSERSEGRKRSGEASEDGSARRSLR